MEDFLRDFILFMSDLNESEDEEEQAKGVEGKTGARDDGSGVGVGR